jgi:hypothetical protein
MKTHKTRALAAHEPSGAAGAYAVKSGYSCQADLFVAEMRVVFSKSSGL